MSPETKAELAKLCESALAVQDACNLSGVVQGFAKDILTLRRLLNLGTDATNTHPIVVLWADKIAHLTGTQELGNPTVMAAYTTVYKLLGECQS